MPKKSNQGSLPLEVDYSIISRPVIRPKSTVRGMGVYNKAALRGMGVYNKAALRGMGAYPKAAMRGMGSAVYPKAATRGMGIYVDLNKGGKLFRKKKYRGGSLASGIQKAWTKGTNLLKGAVNTVGDFVGVDNLADKFLDSFQKIGPDMARNLFDLTSMCVSSSFTGEWPGDDKVTEMWLDAGKDCFKKFNGELQKTIKEEKAKQSTTRSPQATDTRNQDINRDTEDIANSENQAANQDINTPIQSQGRRGSVSSRGRSSSRRGRGGSRITNYHDLERYLLA